MADPILGMDIRDYIHSLLRHEASNTGLFYFSLISLLFSVAFLLGWFSASQAVSMPTLSGIEYNTYSCRTIGKNENIFSVYALSEFSGKELANHLCFDRRIATAFSTVRVQWRHPRIKNIDIVQDGNYDLLISTPTHIERPQITGIAGYEKIGFYPQYSGYFIFQAGTTMPQLSKAFMIGKRIALRDSALSQSGHTLPRQALRAAGIEEALIEIVYLKTHQQLRDALVNREVDAIGSYWSDEDIARYGELPRVELKGHVPSSSWYLAPHERHILCAVNDALGLIAKAATDGYFSQLQLIKPCAQGK